MAADPTTTSAEVEPGEGRDFASLATAAAPSLEQRIAETERDLTTARTKQEAAGESVVAAQGRRKEAAAPYFAQAQQRLSAPQPAQPPPAVLPPPPTRKLTDFLAHTDGEAPENTISKLIQSITLMATGSTGLARGDATAALASMKGALQGWQEGDKQRADRAFSDWKANVDRLLENADQEQRTWRNAFEAKKLATEDGLQMLRIALEAHGMDVEQAKTVTQNADEAVKFLTGRQDHRDKLKSEATKLQGMYEEKRRHEEFLLQMKQAEVERRKEADQALIAQYTPEALKALGQQWAMTGKMPSGVGVGRSGGIIKGMVTKAGIEWAKEQGIDPMQFPAIQNEMAAAKGSLATLKRQNATQTAAIARLDGHLDALLKLSTMVPRSEMPAVNAAILKFERDYKGSPEAAAYVFQAFEVGMEFARVVVPGNAQGDASTREHARDAIAPALNNGQVETVVKQLRQNAHRNIETNAASEKLLSEFVDSVGGRVPSKPMAAPPGSDPNDPLGLRKKQ